LKRYFSERKLSSKVEIREKSVNGKCILVVTPKNDDQEVVEAVEHLKCINDFTKRDKEFSSLQELAEKDKIFVRSISSCIPF